MKKLSLGCGKRNFGSDWIHIDGSNFPHVYANNITKLPFEDNSIDLIYSSHTLEYFDREEVIKVLNEWKRVLKIDGELFLSVPDFNNMARLYVTYNIPLHKFLGPLYGKMSMDNSTIYHKTVYDYSSLGELLRFIGFKRIEPWKHSEVQWGGFDDHSHAKINDVLISLNIKCQK